MNDKTIGVDKENVRFSRRWINRQVEDFEAGEGPRVTIKSGDGLKHQITFTEVPNTTSTSTEPTRRPTDSNEDSNPDIPWLNLQSPESSIPSYSSDSVTNFPATATKTIQWPSSTTVRPPITYFNDDQDIPWVILKSPEQTYDQQSSSSFGIYPQNNQPDNVNQVTEMTFSTPNPWLALKYAHLRKTSTYSSKSTSSYNQHYYSNGPSDETSNTVNREILKTTDPVSITAKYDPTGLPMTTYLPTTAPPTTSTPEATSNLNSYSTQQETTIFNQNEFNSFPTFPTSNETPAATNVISPAPTESSLTVVGSPENDFNISNIGLSEEKFSFTKLQRTLKRTFNKFMKIIF